MLGEDFTKARSSWLYPREPQQNFWRALLIGVGVFVAYQLLQGVLALAIYLVAFHGGLGELSGMVGSGNSTTTSPTQALMYKSGLLSIFPSGVIVAALVLYLSQFGLPGRMGKLPVEWPKINFLGWALIVVGFILVMLFAASGVFQALGLDPSAYEVSSKGLSDTASKAGIIEKTLADMANDPLLLGFGALSAIIGAPLAEEFLFRGLLFAGIAKTRAGWPGAVLISAGTWAVAHAFGAPWIFVGVIFGMGLILGLLMLRFGSLWVTIACHTAWNVLVTLPMFSLGSHT
ncbi:CPBP family intramembrane glutamic endopeptidase [Aestuariivirga litoralis]|uniref:CPBP family intramembrane glutamic endopeptidase n=1 Tax=Aestuariivirga litoralis TaxID=2650924 RepID=UPI0018C71786|nr:CPBP family intramembrane glutamic endopeptidase [Aestuariivirga litoralis]MBG1231182.1 CPBP family intramembrane metalloprotease [Aestuariivirga litoralis]